MKKIALMVSATLLLATQAFCQAPASPRVKTEGKEVTVAYGQPSKKGREVFGKLVPFGQVWRTGANEATEITFKKDVTFGGKPVKAGTYTLFTIPTAKEWTVILNKDLGQFGAFDYKKANDVLTIKVPVKALSAEVEKFTIEAKDASVDMMWDKTSVSVPVK